MLNGQFAAPAALQPQGQASSPSSLGDFGSLRLPAGLPLDGSRDRERACDVTAGDERRPYKPGRNRGRTPGVAAGDERRPYRPGLVVGLPLAAAAPGGSPGGRRPATSAGPTTQNVSRRLRVLLLAFLACFVVPAAASAESGPKTIVFFGDSLTAGYGLDDPTSEAFPAQIAERIKETRLDYRVVNAGLSGETSAGGLRRVDWILRQPIDVFVLALGANDGLRGIEPAVTRANLQGIIDRVRAKYPQVRLVLAGMMMPPSMGADYAREYAAIFPALAKENDATFVPFLLEGVGGDEALNQADRIHPTAEGHAIVAANVWNILRPLL